MARKSAADLTVVPLSGGGRPPPPAYLDATEQSIWKAVVDASPAYAIDPAAQLILKRLVAQAALCEQREARLRASLWDSCRGEALRRNIARIYFRPHYS